MIFEARLCKFVPSPQNDSGIQRTSLSDILPRLTQAIFEVYRVVNFFYTTLHVHWLLQKNNTNKFMDN